MKKNIVLDFLVPCLILVAATILLAISNADIRLESLFYSPGGGWVHANDPLWNFLYRFGPLPGLILGGVAASVLLISFFSIRASRYRRVALFFVLLLALGPGLFISLSKDTLHRPRPRQVENFSGEKKFLQVWQIGPSEEGKSFPSSHAAIAFYLSSPYFVLRRSSAKWARWFLVFGLPYGALLGLTRMVQGGHFPSDILWSAGFVHLTGLVLYYALRLDRNVILQQKQ
jgi:lipid A 4'-phosphatase